jgi:hypothetical protein
MGIRLRGAAWLFVSFVLLLVTVVTTLYMLAANFMWEPDEHPASYWQHQIPVRQWAMTVAMVVPAASIAAAVTGMYARPRRTLRVGLGIILTVLALVGFIGSWGLGVQAVKSATYWAEHSH